MKIRKPHILIIDDDRAFADELGAILSEIATVDTVYTEESFYEIYSPYRYDTILLDLRLREGQEGISLLDYILDREPGAAVVVISAYGDIATAVEVLNKGAKAFIEKGKFSLDAIRQQIEQTLNDMIAFYLFKGNSDYVQNKSIYTSLAEYELRLAEIALVQCDGKKTEAWKIAGYKDRFAMRRRLKKLIGNYPDMAVRFPTVYEAYK